MGVESVLFAEDDGEGLEREVEDAKDESGPEVEEEGHAVKEQ